MRAGEQLAGLVLGRVQELAALPLALLPVALDLLLPVLEIAVTAADLLLGPPELRRRSVLRVGLDRVGELRSRADQMQRIHAHGVSRRLDGGAAPGRLEHAELGLQLGRVAPEGVEGIPDALGVEAVADARYLLDRRQRRQRRSSCCGPLALG